MLPLIKRYAFLLLFFLKYEEPKQMRVTLTEKARRLKHTFVRISQINGGKMGFVCLWWIWMEHVLDGGEYMIKLGFNGKSKGVTENIQWISVVIFAIESKQFQFVEAFYFLPRYKLNCPQYCCGCDCASSAHPMQGKWVPSCLSVH